MSVMGIGQGHAVSATGSAAALDRPAPLWPGNHIGDAMRRVSIEFRHAGLQWLGAAALALLVGVGGAFAQSGDPKAEDQSKQPAAGQNGQQASDAAKDNQKKTDEFAEAAQAINGPAGNPECVWLGRRVVALMWRDDLDTAFRHLDLYDRFGCPTGHIQAAFRCLVRSGPIDPKVPESLSGRVHACWINPNAQSQASAPQTTPAAPAPTAKPAQPATPQAAPTPAPSK